MKYKDSSLLRPLEPPVQLEEESNILALLTEEVTPTVRAAFDRMLSEVGRLRQNL